MPEQRPTPPGLEKFWNGSVEDFVDLSPDPITPEEQERHGIFSLLLMGIVYSKWNGNKCGEVGDYGDWRAEQTLGKSKGGYLVYEGGSYLGHNIAALAVDGEGRIIDFDFNHNQVYDSTVEHAESRLVRRVFSLNQIYDPWFALDRSETTAEAPTGALHARRNFSRRNLFATNLTQPPLKPGEQEELGTEIPPTAPVPYASMLKDVTIYTSLESCAQCSGIMCLGSVKEIVYLQWDQGQFLIGNIMRQATTAQQMGFVAPRPIRGDEFGFSFFEKLNTANQEFEEQVEKKPFYEGPSSPGKPVNSKAVTSFLCTDQARRIYAEASRDFGQWQQARYPDFKPSPSSFSNQEVLVQAKDFLGWVSELDSRGAPHRV